MTLRAVDARG